MIRFDWYLPADPLRWVWADWCRKRNSRAGLVSSEGLWKGEGKLDGAAVYLASSRPSRKLDFGEEARRLVVPMALERTHEVNELEFGSALFREFASLTTSFKDVRNFAEMWGPLGSDAEYDVGVLKGTYDEHIVSIWAEFPGSWVDEITKMRGAVLLSDLIQGGSTRALRKYISAKGNSVSLEIPDIRTPQEKKLISAQDANFPHVEETLDAVVRGEKEELLIEPLRNFKHTVSLDVERLPYLKDAAKSRNLRTFARLLFEDLTNWGLRGRVSGGVRFDEKEGAFETCMIPDSLIGFLWLQISLAVSRSSEFGRCVVCHKWFEIAPGSGRPDKRYCSDACRMRAYRTRKKNEKRNG